MTADSPDHQSTARTHWLETPAHRHWLQQDAERQLDFFAASLRHDGGFDVLATDGTPLPRHGQELHTTTRLIHSYVLGEMREHPAAADIIDAGMQFLWQHHRDRRHGGYFWSVDEAGLHDGNKLAYGHVFVLLAASSATLVDHPDAPRLLEDISEVIERHFWDEEAGLLCDEFTSSWQPFSDYRGMNSNMHGVEAMLAAFEATGDSRWLERAARILDFFVTRMAPRNTWRLPEHYTSDWQVDPDYAGNPMFRPAGTTPGHSFELARLQLQQWDLAGRPDNGAPERARQVIEQALVDAWLPEGGLAYTLHRSGRIAIADRYWWPVCEAIGALASLLKLDGLDVDEAWYRRLWQFADTTLIDHQRGGWYPELDEFGQPSGQQFRGKPDIYHSLQAVLYPLTPGLSRQSAALRELPLPQS